jgi:hypothetical protein
MASPARVSSLNNFFNVPATNPSRPSLTPFLDLRFEGSGRTGASSFLPLEQRFRPIDRPLAVESYRLLSSGLRVERAESAALAREFPRGSEPGIRREACPGLPVAVRLVSRARHR